MLPFMFLLRMFRCFEVNVACPEDVSSSSSSGGAATLRRKCRGMIGGGGELQIEKCDSFQVKS